MWAPEKIAARVREKTFKIILYCTLRLAPAQLAAPGEEPGEQNRARCPCGHVQAAPLCGRYRRGRQEKATWFASRRRMTDSFLRLRASNLGKTSSF